MTPQDSTITTLQQRIAELEAALAACAQRERELRDQTTRLQYIIDGSSDGAWDWDLVTNEAFLSPRWFEMLGFAPNELPNTADTWFSLLHPDDAPAVKQALQDYLAGRTPTYAIENRLRCKSGAWLWTLARGKVVVRDAQGQPLRMTGTVTDITARKQAEAALRHNQALLEGMIDHSPAVIYVRDLTGRFLLVNQHHAALLRRDRSEIIGKTDAELFPPEVVAGFRANDRMLLEARTAVTAEEVVPHDDGPHTYLSIKFPLFDDAGQIYATGGISTDITEHKRAAEERALLQEEVIAAQKAALRELSTPLIPLSDEILIMPLIGSIDSQRAQQVMNSLLAGIEQHRARTVVMDITGVQVMDTQVANAVMQAAQAARLLGAEVLLTGIGPEVAQTIVGMGAHLSGVVTYGNLQAGIAAALRHNRTSGFGSLHR